MTENASRLSSALVDRYRIESRLGEGGMATVYLAVDLKHDRKVALKVLKPELTKTIGPARFVREVQIAARLTHPHILGLHDSGEADGFLFYVMPFVEGQSLRQRLSVAGELPIVDATRVLRDISDALAYAHDHDVVHRDIKPDNVMISGRHALVTDFGIAKALSDASGGPAVTTAGVALGTPAYMAPEQAAAEAVDHRADIYALGVLAYEMLTGVAPFTGRTAQQVLAAQMTDVPKPTSELRPAIPPALDQLVLRCLEKRPADRYQSADAMLRELEELATPTQGMIAAPASGVGGRKRLTVRTIALTGAALGGVIVGLLAWSSLRVARDVPGMTNYRTVTRGPEPETNAMLSPDGRTVAFEAVSGSDVKIFLRDIAGGSPIALTANRPGTQRTPRWMPDGNAVTFEEEGSTYVIPRFGGLAEVLIEDAVVWGIHDSSMAFSKTDSLRISAGLFIADLPSPSAAREIVAPDQREVPAVWSPDGRRLAIVTGNTDFSRRANVGPASIWIVGRGGGDPVAVVDDGNQNLSPAWLPDGQSLLFVSDRDGPRDIYLVRVDRNGRSRGQPTRVTNGLDAVSVSLSEDGGTAVYVRLTVRGNLWSLPTPGPEPLSLSQAEPVFESNEIIEQFQISDDGKTLLFDSNREGNQDIYVMPFAGGDSRRLTSDPGDDFSPDLSPDGTEIVFYSTRFGQRDLFLIGIDGTGERRLTEHPGSELHPKFSPDGGQIVFDRYDRDEWAPHILSRDSTSGLWVGDRRVPNVPGKLGSGSDGIRWSPDGQLVRSTNTGIITFTPDGQWQQIVDASANGIVRFGGPIWSADGSMIYFEGTGTEGRALYAVSAMGGPIRPVVSYDDPRIVVWDWYTRPDRLFASLKHIDADVMAFDLSY